MLIADIFVLYRISPVRVRSPYISCIARWRLLLVLYHRGAASLHPCRRLPDGEGVNWTAVNEPLFY